MRLLRSLAAALALFAALPAGASTDYTDIWWAAGGAEPGWGVNFAQQEHAIFATFYIFGPSGAPVWYTALLTRTFGETFTGPVHASSGTWFGAPWVSPPPATAVGSAMFIASSPHRGAFNYRIDTVQVARTIERFAFVPLSIDGAYLGANAGAYSGNCPASTPATFIDTRQLIVSQSGNPGTVTIEFRQAVSPFASVCTMEGAGTQFGRMITIANGSYICPGFPTIPVTVQSIRPLDDGIEMRWEADDAGCVERGRAAGVKQ
jgi:hypothetical protein